MSGPLHPGQSSVPPPSPRSEGERGARCICGHYDAEHDHNGCHGAYGTLMADADDLESVEVPCRCKVFWKVNPGHHPVRT